MKVAFSEAAVEKPTMIWDGDCGFCAFWISRWKRLTGEAVQYVPLQDAKVAQCFPELSKSQLERSVHLVERDGAVYAGAEAVFRALAANAQGGAGLKLPFWIYKNFSGFAVATEWAYRQIASHREAISKLNRLLFEEEPPAPRRS